MTPASRLSGPASLILAVAVTAPLLAGCAREPRPAAVGERLEYRGYAMTVTKIEKAADFPGARRARQGDTLLAIEILIESHADGVVVSPAHMWVAEPGGKVFKPHKTGVAPILQESTGVAKGQQVRGWLTFEVPKDARDLRFVNELPQDFSHAMLKVNLK